MHVNKSTQAGFSLIELVISIAIIAIILGMIVPAGARLFNKSSMASVQSLLKTINSAILEYKSDVHALPEKLEDLDKRPEGVTGWNGSYLPESMQGKEVLDYWKQPLIYKKNERGAKKAYELYSEGNPEKEEDRIYAE